jgi:hypothetical protein
MQIDLLNTVINLCSDDQATTGDVACGEEAVEGEGGFYTLRPESFNSYGVLVLRPNYCLLEDTGSIEHLAGLTNGKFWHVYIQKQGFWWDRFCSYRLCIPHDVTPLKAVLRRYYHRWLEQMAIGG